MSGFPQIVNADGSWHYTGSAGGFGATVRLTAPVAGYPHSGTDDANLANAQQFDAFTGVPGALLRQKVYLQPCDQVGLAKGLPVPLPSGWQPFTQQGGILTISVRPPQTPTAAGDAAFVAFVDALGATLGASYELSLWQEMDQGQFGFTPDSYAAFAGHYASLFLANGGAGALVLNPALTAPTDASGEKNVLAILQTAASVAPWRKVLLDYYCTSWRRGGRLEAVSAAVDAMGLPLGIGETGAAASDMPFDRNLWEEFCDYVADHFRGRLAAGRDNAQIMWWMGSAPSGSGADYILQGDDKLAGLLRLARVANGG